MLPLRDRYEPFIAWRYLYRRRRSSAVVVLTALFAALSVLALVAVFTMHGEAQVIGTSLSLPSLLLFLFFLLLNLFSGFTAVSIIGVTIGVLALVVVLSVTSGFQQSFKQKVLGVITDDKGRAKDGSEKPDFQPGMALTGKYTLFAEGCRGHLGKRLIAHFNLAEGRDPQSYSIGIKELWDIDPAKHKPGLVMHTAG